MIFNHTTYIGKTVQESNKVVARKKFKQVDAITSIQKELVNIAAIFSEGGKSVSLIVVFPPANVFQRPFHHRWISGFKGWSTPLFWMIEDLFVPWNIFITTYDKIIYHFLWKYYSTWWLIASSVNNICCQILLKHKICILMVNVIFKHITDIGFS